MPISTRSYAMEDEKYLISGLARQSSRSILQAGHVEPLGCHRDYRHLAFGRVALSHGLSRLAGAEAREISVETDSYRNMAYGPYESFGFEVLKNVLVYRKDNAAGDG